jgi:hypothetical protein
MVFTISCFVLPQLYKIATYKRAIAQVSGTIDQHLRRRTDHYPIIYFETEAHKVRFTAPSFMYEMMDIGSHVEVFYDPERPSQAYVNNFWGLWGTRFIYFFPIFILLTACTFSVDLLPKTIKIF